MFEGLVVLILGIQAIFSLILAYFLVDHRAKIEALMRMVNHALKKERE